MKSPIFISNCLSETFRHLQRILVLLLSPLLLGNLYGGSAVQFSAPVTLRTNFTGTVGFSFIPTTAITITHLGFWDNGGDGLALSHQIGIWQNTGAVLLASATVPSGTTAEIEGGFRYVQLSSPLVLSAGQLYRIGAGVESSDGFCESPTGFTSNSKIGYFASVYDSGVFSFPGSNSNPTIGYFGTNFKFVEPVVSNVSPATGSTAGGTNVTITGTGFTGATGVTIGGVAATSVAVVNDTTITAVTPAGTAGSASVVVTTAGGSNAANTLYTFVVPPDYIVTTTGNAIVVTDSTGNGETLTISEPSAGNIQFAAAGRNFSVDGGANVLGNSGSLSLTGVTSITVNAGAGTDIINVGAFTGTLTSLTLNGGIGNDTVNLNGDVTFAVDTNLDVDLSNDDASPGTDSVVAAAGANLIVTGTGTITLKGSGAVSMAAGSSVESVDGAVLLQSTASELSLTGATVTTAGIGNVTLTGTGTGEGGGISISGGSVVSSTGTGLAANQGLLTLTGTGSGSGTGFTLGGASSVTSVDGAISITGSGTAVGVNRTSKGIIVDASTVQSTGTATITLTGKGNSYDFGSDFNAQHHGIQVSGATALITSAAGKITLDGDARYGRSANNFGVVVQNGAGVTGTGTAEVELIGITRIASGIGYNGNGIVITGTGSRVTTVNGPLKLTGTGANQASSIGVLITTDGQVASTAGDITITGSYVGGGNATGSGILYDSATAVSTSGTISLVSGTGIGARMILSNGSISGTAGVTVRAGASVPIDLGSTTDTDSRADLSDAELDLITTSGTLVIGDANSGAITISAVISPANFKTLDIQKGVTFSATGGFASDVTSATVFEKIRANGAVSINTSAGLTATAFGGYVPTQTNAFTILDNVSASTTTGNFSGKTEGTLVAIGGVNRVITYSGGTGNDVVFTYFAPTVTTPTSTAVATTTATLGGNVTSDGTANISARGVVYSVTATNSNPQIGGTGVTTAAGTGTTGVFTVDVSSLLAGTAYTYAAYATNAAGTSYSATGTFTTTADFVPGTGVTVTYSGVIGGTTPLSITGGGTLELTGANTYNANTNVQDGTVSINTVGTGTNAQSLGAGNVVNLGMANTSSGTLTYTGGAGTLDKAINALGNGSDTVQNSGSGLLTLSGTLTKTGTRLTLRGGAQGIRVTGTITGDTGSPNSDLIIDGGTTTLATANSYNGPTYIINGGTLNADAVDALPTSPARSDILMDQTGTGSSTLALGVSQSVLSLTGAGTSALNLNANSLTVGGASGSSTFAGVISGVGGSLIKDGASTLVLSGSNTYTGGTNVTAGTIVLANQNGFGTGTVTLAGGVNFSTSGFEGNSVGGALPNALVLSGGMVNVDVSFGAKDIWINTGVSGTGGFSVAGAGAIMRHPGLMLSGANTFQGGVTIANQTRVSIDNNTSLGTGGLRAASGTGTLRVAGNVSNVANSVVVASGATLNVEVDSGIGGLLSGVISSEGAGGSLTKSDTGTLTLTGANTYTGATTVSAGVLNIQNADALGTTAAGTSVASGAALQIQGNITTGAEALTLNGTGVSSDGALRNISGGNTYAGLVTLGSATRINSDAGTLTLSNAGTITGAGLALTVGGAGNTTINSIIGTGAGTLTKDGSGTLALTGANTYTGATTVSAGALNIQNAAALGTTAAGTSVTSGAALEMQGGISVGNEALTLNGTGVSAAGALRSISGTNIYGGVVTLGSDSRINTDSGALLLTNGTITGAGFGLTVGGDSNTIISSIIGTGTGTLTKDGNGVLALTGANTYTGTTTISAGILTIGNSSTTGSLSTSSAIVNNATLLFARTNLLTQGTDFSNVISGSGTVIQGSIGTTVLSGANTYTGTTSVVTGVLNIQNAAALGTVASGTTVEIGAALQIQGDITTAAEALTLNGTGVSNDGALRNISGTNTYAGLVRFTSDTRINSDAGTLTLSNTGTITGAGLALTVGGAGNTRINSIIGTGTGTVTKDGAGTLTLAGANTYTGATTVSTGVLDIRNANALGTTAGGTTVASGAALQIQGVITTAAEALTLNGTGVSNGGALRNITGSNTYAGLVTLGSDTRINSDAFRLTLSNTGTITGSGFGLTVGGADGTIINSIIGTGTGTLTKDGNGLLTLTGANTYTGTTTISAGSLSIGNGGTTGSLSTSSAITNNGTLSFNRSNTVAQGTDFASVISGSGAVTQAGTGTLVFSGANTYTGATTINSGGTLQIGAGGTTGALSTSSAITNNGTLTFNRSNTITQGTDFNSVISGSGAVTQAGSGTVVLNGANTYTGVTTVSAGILNIQNADALGTTAAGTTVASGAALQIRGSITTAAEALTLNGTGVSNDGALLSVNGTNVYAGLVTLGSDTRINATASNLTLSNAGTITGAGFGLTLGSTNNLQIDSIIGTGSGTLTKDGVGTLILTGANTYSGVTTVSEGLLNIRNNAALGGTAGETIVASGATLQMQGAITTANEPLTLNGTGVGGIGALNSFINNNTYSGLVTLGSDSRINASFHSLTLSNTGTITGSGFGLTVGGGGSTTINSIIGTTSGTVTKDGAGTLTLTGANTYTGTTTISGGSLSIGAGGTTGSLATSSAIVNNATLIFNRSNTLTQGTDFATVISGSGAVTQAGSGTTILSGANTYTGATTVSAGTLQLGNGGTTGSLSTSSAITNNSALIFNRSNTVTQGTDFATVIGGSGTVQKSGSGTLILSGANTYTGATTVSTGVLNIRNATALGTTAAGTSVTSGAALQVEGGITTGAEALTLNGTGVSTDGALRNISGTNNLAGLVTLGSATRINSDAGTLTLSNTGTITGSGFGLTVGGAGNTTINGIIGTGTGTLTKDGAGTLTLTGINTFTGVVTVNAGTIAANGPNSFNSALGSASSIVVNNGGTITVGGNNSFTGGYDGTGGAKFIQINAGGVVANNVGAVANHLYRVVMNGGTLSATTPDPINSNWNFDYGVSTLGNGSTSLITGGNAALTQTGGTTFNIGAGDTLNVATQLAAVHPSVPDTGLIKTGTGTMTLSGANNYASATTINGGILNVQHSTGLGTTAAGTSVSNGATLQLQGGITVGAEALSLNGGAASGQTGALVNVSGTNTYGGAITVTASSSISAASGSVLNLTGGVVKNGTVATLNGGGTINISTVGISGALANSDLVIDGTTVNLDVASTYNGPTFIRNSGTLNANVVGALPTGTRSALTFDGTGTSVLTLGAAQSVASLTAASTATITLNANTITVGDAASNTTFAGAIGGTGGLTKDDASTQILSGSNGYSGTTTVSAGTLSISGDINSSTTLSISGGLLSTTGADKLANAAAVTVSGGTLTVGGADTVSTLAMSSGTIGGSATLTATTYNLSGGTVDGNLGTGTLNSSGTVALNGTAAAAVVNVTAGTLTLGSADRLANGATVTVSGGTLALGTNNDTVSIYNMSSGSITGSGTLTATTYGLSGGTVDANLGTGTINSSGNVALNGTAEALAVNITAGTMTLGNNDRLANGATVTVSGGTLALGTNNDTVSIYNMSSGSITGSGTLTATTYGLSGGTVDGNLGTGTLNSSGTVALNGTAGATAVNITAGTLTLGSSDRLANGATVTLSGGTLALGTNNDTVGAVVLTSGSITGTSGVLTSGSTYDVRSGSVSAILGGTVGLTKTTGGTVTLTNANTYTGTTTVSAGTLALSGAGRLSDSSSLVVNGGTFDIGTVSDTVAGVQLASGSITGTSGVLTSSSTFDVQSGSVSAILGGTVGLAKTTGSTVTLSNANTYTGTTTVSAGTLALSGAGRLSDSSSLVVSGGVFSIGTVSDTVAGVQLASGSITGSTGVLTSSSTYDVQSGSVSAILGGSVGLTKTTAGTVTLSGTNSYTGATTLTAGNLVVSGSIGSSSLTTIDGGTLLGTGTVGAIQLNSGGTINAGGAASAGTLNTGNIAIVDGQLHFNIGGTGSHDQLSTTGTINLAAGGAGAKLVIDAISGYTATLNNAFTLVSNDLADAISGAFAKGTFGGTKVITLSGVDYVENVLGSNYYGRINYAGSSSAPGTLATAGNDIIMKVVTPEITITESGNNQTDGGTYDFGDVDKVVPAVPLTKTFTIKNDGEVDLMGIVINAPTGAAASDYTLNLTGTASTLIPGASTTFTITFSPSRIGTRTAAIVIDNNDLDENPFNLALTGVGAIARDVSEPWTVLYGGVDAPATRRNGVAMAVVVQKSTTRDEAVAVFATGYTTNASLNRDIYTAKYDPVTGALLWERIYAGAANMADEAAAIAVDANGDVVITGFTTVAANDSDVYVAKYSGADGSVLWERTYAGSGNSFDEGNSIAVHSSGRVLVAGYGRTVSSGADLFAAGYSGSDGSVVFERLIDGGSNGDDVARSVAVDSAGDLAIAGFVRGSGKDFRVMKLNGTNGTTAWQWNVNGSASTNDEAFSVAFDSTGQVVATGAVSSANFDLYTVKLTAAGALVWQNQWNSSFNSSDAGYDIAVDSSGNVIVGGSSYRAASVMDGYVAEYAAATGALIWERRFNGSVSNQDVINSVDLDGLGNVIAAGFSYNAIPNSDVLTAKIFATDGGLVWEKRYNGAGGSWDNGASVAVSTDGNVYVGGYAGSDFLVKNYQAVIPAVQTSQFIAFSNPGGPRVAGSDLPLSASASSGLPVKFSIVSGPATVNDSGNTLSFTGTGTVTVRASQQGSSIYARATPVDQSFTVIKSNQTITFTPPASLSSTAQWPLTGLSTSGLALTYSVQSGPGTITGGVLSFSGSGVVTVRASQAGDVRFNAAANVDATITSVNHAPIIILDNIAENWRDRYAGSGAGEGNDLALQLSGNDAVAGFVGGYTTTGTGKDLYLVKYLADGTLVWSVISGTSGDDEAMSVKVDGNGDVLVAGYITSGTGKDVYVAKYNGGTGARIWSYTYNGTGNGNDVGVSLDLDGTTNVVVGAYVVSTGAGNDFFAAKLNQSTGAVVWTSVQNRSGANSDVPAKVVVGTDGSAVLAGISGSDAWTVKLAAATGSKIWQQVYNYANKPDAVRGLALDAANNVIIAAYSQGANYDIYTAKYAALDGSIIWGQRYNSSFNSSDHPWDLAVDEDSNVYVTGASYRAASVRDGMTLKYAGLDGALLWEGRYNGTSSANDENFTIALDGIGNPVISGYTTNADGTTDVYLAKHNKVPGTIRWQNTFDGANNKNDTIHKVKVDPNGNVWMAGSATAVGGQLEVLVLRDIPTF